MTTPAKILLSWQNQVDLSGAILSASSAAGDLAVDNLANPIVGRRWRTTDLTAWGQVDFGADVSLGVLALVFPRDTSVPTAGTVTHQLDADGGTAGAGAAYDSGAVAIGTSAGYGYHVHVPASTQSARYWRFTFNVSGVDWVDVGRAWAGEAWRPTYSIAFGYDDGWRDLSRISASERSGAEFVDARARQREFAFGLNALSDSEASEIREMDRIAGLSGQLLFVKDPESPGRETILGRMASSSAIRHANIDIHSKAFALRESL